MVCGLMIIINSNKRASQTTLEISRCMKCTESRQTEAFEGRFARSCRIGKVHAAGSEG
jgi:hypothetical protein